MSEVCLLCKKQLVNRKGLSCHTWVAHRMKFCDYVVKFEYDDVHPLCKCGCGNRTRFFGGKFCSYLDHHQPSYVRTSETIEKTRKIWLGRKHTEQTRHKMSTSQVRCFSDPKRRQQQSKALTGITRSAETRMKTSETRKRMFASGELTINAEKISATMAQKFINDEFKWKTGHYSPLKCSHRTKCRYRSSWELAYMILLDQDSDVVSWQFEWTKIPYTFQNNVKNYVPDFLVTRRDGSKTLVEVKVPKLQERPMNIAKMKAALDFCVLNQWKIAFWPERNL